MFPLSISEGLYRINGFLITEMPDLSGVINVSMTFDDGDGPQTVDLSGTQPITVQASFPCSGQVIGSNVFHASLGNDITFTVTITGDTGSSINQLYLVLEQLM